MNGGTPGFHREIRGGKPWSDEPKPNPQRGKAREKTNRHPHGEVLLDNADAVIDALPAVSASPLSLEPQPGYLNSLIAQTGKREVGLWIWRTVRP
jgi:hypothetical protein